jgi:transaldolase
VNRTTIKIGQESKPKSGVGISYQEVVTALEADGVEKFVASWDELIHTVSSALGAAR